MRRDYATGAIVLGSIKLGEADRIVTLFTADWGKVPAVVKGVRKIKSRFGGRLEPFTHLDVQLFAGRSLHTLTGADTVRTHAPTRDSPASLKAALSYANLLARSTPELERRPRTFNLTVHFLDQMDVVSNSEPAAAALLSLAAQLKLLLLAGYLPRLSSCAACGKEGDFSRFSPPAGGCLCPGCEGHYFTVSPETLKVMRSLLEKPLLGTAAAEARAPVAREIWQILGEICRFQLGVDLKVEPWY